ncbi:MAG: glycoside hydrolase family 31 protein [Polyangiaceae bacterium]
MQRSSFTASLLLAALALPACDGTETGPIPPVEKDLGISSGFRVRYDGAGERILISSDDGRVLLDGLPAADIPEGEPPLTGFAVRDLTISYDMQFGAFKPTDLAKGPWRPVKKIVSHDESAPSGEALIDLQDDAGNKLAEIHYTTPEDGHLVLDIAPGDGPERRFSMGFSCEPTDSFAGFGSQTHDVDHRGQTVPAFVQEQGIGKADNDEYTGAWFLVGRRHSSHIPIPQYLSRRGYVLTTETDIEPRFALCSESETAARVEVQLPTRIHIFDGPDPKQALTRSSATFGRPRMPPRVAFAPWNDAIFGSEAVRGVAQRLRDNNVPSSVLWSEDWKGAEWSGDGYSLSEEWKVDETLYPDFPQLASDLHAQGFHLHVYFNPFIYKSSSAWEETEKNGWLIKKADGTPYIFTGAKFTDSSLIDLTHPDARAWVISKMHDAMAQGADGWMNDFAEWLPTDCVTYAGSGYDVHNKYPVLWQEVAREAIDTAPDGQKDRLFFGRSGWLGTPALADVIWAGDQRTDMQPDDGLPTIVPIGIGLGITGVSTYGHDIAGYQSATNEVSSKETFFRWTELGAWSPVMRTHHGTKPSTYPGMDPVMNQEQWRWDTDAETIDHYRKYASLHISLTPVWESLAREAADTGVPIWRGLFVAHPEDPKTWPLLDEVMVGDTLLLAPVMTKGQTSREVYLPAGTWYPWDGGPKLEGETTVTAPAPLASMPVYARAGAIVPTFPEGVMTLVHGSPEVPGPESVGDDRVIFVFLGDAGAFEESPALSYSLTQSAPITSPLAFELNGTALPACAATPVAPCVAPLADGATVHMEGPGTLAIAGSAGSATFAVDGGSPTRKLTLHFRN